MDSQERDKLVKKLQHLLTMKERATENEAANAAHLIQTLTLRYGISMAEIEVEQNEQDSPSTTAIELVTIEETKSKQHWKGWILQQIALSNFCRYFWRKSGGRTHQKLILVGKPHNVLICKELYSYLTATVERLCEEAVKAEQSRYKDYLKTFDPLWGTPQPTPNWKQWRDEFKKGCSERLSKRLERQRKQAEESGLEAQAATSDSSATQAVPGLVIRAIYEKEQTAIAKYLANQGIGLRSSRGTTVRPGSNGYKAGQSAGSSIGLNKQVGGGGGSRQLRG